MRKEQDPNAESLQSRITVEIDDTPAATPAPVNLAAQPETKVSDEPRLSEPVAAPTPTNPLYVRSLPADADTSDWTDDETDKYQKGWDRLPVHRYNSRTHQREQIGWKMVLPYQEQYWKIRFFDKGTPTEANAIDIGVNTNILTAARGKVTIMPRSHLMAADEAVYEVFGQDEKGNVIPKYRVQPIRYDVLDRNCTRQEFETELKKGNELLAKLAEMEKQQVPVMTAIG